MKKIRILFLNVGFWVLYALLLAIIRKFIVNMGNGHDHIDFLNHLFLYSLIIPAMVSYVCYYFFVFNLYLKKVNAFKIFLVALIITLLVTALMSILYNLKIPDTYKVKRSSDISFGLFFIILFITTVVGSIAFIIRAFIAWFDDQKIKEELKTQNHQMELALVKSQLDPHFLFNTLNNIDILIKNEPQKASAYLNQLSDIMRFMLFETKSDKIELQEEIRYLEKYIQLQKIRSSSTDFITFKVEGDCSAQITPMILIPFVENAFKHVSSTAIKGAIQIGVICKKNAIVFSCSNHFQENKKDQIESHQIGHELIEKRINLNYPKNNELNISTKNGIYAVSLILTWDEN
jgi:two-component system LytT family sensor kinase